MNKSLILCCTLACYGAALFAQPSAPLAEPAEVWEQRRARAASLRSESTQIREQADAKRRQEDIACRKAFFENACRDGARERWLSRINLARAMEMEAVGLERAVRAYELASREEGTRRPPMPAGLEFVTGSAPAAGSASARPAEVETAPTLSAEQSAARAKEREEERARRAAAAARRAAQAEEDARRYAERQRARAAEAK